MYRRVVREYVESELKKGKTIEQIRKRLLNVGYNGKDIDLILKTFECREADLELKRQKLSTTKKRVYALVSIIFIIAIVSSVLFFHNLANPNYILVKETPTGLVIEPITEEEFKSLEENLTMNNPSLKGMEEIT